MLKRWNIQKCPYCDAGINMPKNFSFYGMCPICGGRIVTDKKGMVNKTDKTLPEIIAEAENDVKHNLRKNHLCNILLGGIFVAEFLIVTPDILKGFTLMCLAISLLATRWSYRSLQKIRRMKI